MILHRFSKLTLLMVSAIVLSACTNTPQKPVPSITPIASSSASRASNSSGPYAVGSSTFFIHDESRPFDSVAGINTGVRTLITEIWYPVAAADITPQYKEATFGDYVFNNKAVHQQMMTQTTFFHLTPKSVREGATQAQIDVAIDELSKRTRGSFIDAPLAVKGTPWPVIVMTHGDAGSRYNMQTACEYLASQGYIVIAPDHTGNSPFAMIGEDPALAEIGGDASFKQKMADVLPLLDKNGVYGTAATFGQSYIPLQHGFSPQGLVQLDQSVVQRVNDLRAVLDKLEALNAEGSFSGQIDLERIGVMGRSFGGLTTLAALKLEDRFKAGFAVVAPPMPKLNSVLSKTDIAAMATRESALLSKHDKDSLDDLKKPTFLLMGAEDSLILGLASQLAGAMGTDVPTQTNPYPSVVSTLENAEVPVVYGLVENTNHGSFGVSGPYWWPELKPNQLPKFFAPNENYELLTSSEAHRIQKEMALAFFQTFLLEDDSALETIKANPWQAAGTELTVRIP